MPVLRSHARSSGRRRGARRLALAALLLAAPLPAPLPAQPASGAVPPALTLERAVALARIGPLARLGAARAAALAARARQDAAWPNPTAEWRREGVGHDVIADEFLTLAQPVDVTGRRAALRGAARAAGTRAAADSLRAVRDVEALAARAWLRAALAAELRAAAE
ncbi:MAG TPA: hypothetical protein VEZ47_11100, partial [Gemmatirosa sp.]|nr:hypothetical protein [Gemmatirosa sp.]